MKTKTIAVIMAGGRGTRLWPMSRRDKPKQFQALVSERTMLQETFDRLLPVFEAEDIYIATNADYIDMVHEQLPEVSVKNIIGEPALRDTASGTALVTAVIAARHPEAIVATFPADHVITNPEVICEAVSPIVQFLSDQETRNYIVTLGIRPLFPETGFGYIQRGSVLAQSDTGTIYSVAQFVEKPDLPTAKKYIQEGSYEWNAGMFFFRVDAMIEKFRIHAPDTYARLIAIRDAVDSSEYEEVLQAQFMDMEKVSIDYAILEKDEQIAVMPVSLGWSDVGSWAALKDMLSVHSNDNVSRGPHINHQSENCMVYADKPIVTIGLKDVVVVQMDDVTLVCHRDHAQAVSPVAKSLDGGKYQNLL